MILKCTLSNYNSKINYSKKLQIYEGNEGLKKHFF